MGWKVPARMEQSRLLFVVAVYPFQADDTLVMVTAPSSASLSQPLASAARSPSFVHCSSHCVRRSTFWILFFPSGTTDAAGLGQKGRPQLRLLSDGCERTAAVFRLQQHTNDIDDRSIDRVMMATAVHGSSSFKLCSTLECCKSRRFAASTGLPNLTRRKHVRAPAKST